MLYESDSKRLLTNEDVDNLSRFAAYQYRRVPRAIEQKTYELQPAEISEAAKDHALNPGRFVENGYSYVRDRFKAMKILLLVSPGREFLTSDWPCFDLKDSANSPLFGEEIGRNPEVVCYMPLTPRIAAVFFATNFSKAATKGVVSS